MSHVKTSALQPLLLTVCAILLPGCAKTVRDYYPVKSGRAYEYRWTRVYANAKNPRKEEFSATRSFLAPRPMDGKEVVPAREAWSKGGEGYLFIGEDKDGLYTAAVQRIGEAKPEVYTSPRYFLKTPLEQGTNWEVESKILQVREGFPITLKCVIAGVKESVSVPAGTFDRCVKVEYKGVTEQTVPLVGQVRFSREGSDWYAPGVGLVKEISKDECSVYDIGSLRVTGELAAVK